MTLRPDVGDREATDWYDRELRKMNIKVRNLLDVLAVTIWPPKRARIQRELIHVLNDKEMMIRGWVNARMGTITMRQAELDEKFSATLSVVVNESSHED